MNRASLCVLALLSLSTTVGCGANFDPGNEIKSLRVLGVKKDKPYAQPGDDVTLQLLWDDAQGRTEVQRVFVGGCVNPPGDLYYGCFAQYGQKFADGSLPPPGMGDSYQVTLPQDIISGRGGRFQPGQPHAPKPEHSSTRPHQSKSLAHESAPGVSSFAKAPRRFQRSQIQRPIGARRAMLPPMART